MNARKLPTGTLTLSTLGAVWLAASSCSVLYDLNTTQCSTTDECRHKGSAFANSICQNNVCVATSAPSTGGTPSTGGQSSTDTSTGGDVTIGGTSATGGDSGTGGTTTPASTGPSCINADCMKANEANGTYTCIDDKCVPLTTAQCDQLLPQANSNSAYNWQELLKAQNPIIVGGFANMTGATNHHDVLSIISWDLAFSEFNLMTQGGVPGADSSSTQRPLIGLICNGAPANADDFTAAIAHLADDIHVPGIVSTAGSDNLIAAYNYTASKGEPVFFMSSGSASMALTTLQDQNLVWHVLGNPRLLAGTIVSWIKRIEPIVNQARQAYATANPGGPDDPTIPNSLKVLITYNDDNTSLNDLKNILTGGDISLAALTFNGATAADLILNGSLRTVKIASGATDPTPVANEIKANPPHIIIALEGTEFPLKVMPNIESVTWPNTYPNRMRPYYVLAHTLNAQPTMLNAVKSNVYQVDKRITGVNWAQIQDTTSKSLYANWLSNVQASYQSYATATGPLMNSLPGTENHYDAAYYVLYSVAAAAVKHSTFTGINVENAFEQKVINSGAATVGVGPLSIVDTISKMYAATFPAFSMGLWGCDGPPNTFDSATGTRNFPTSVWCIQYDSTQSAWVYANDARLYDPTKPDFTAPSSGVPTCLTNY